MSQDSPIANSLLKYPDIIAFDDMMAARFADIDFSAILVYLIDTAPVNILSYIADQFDALGIKGWKYADTEQKQRDLLKSTLELRRYKGTPWAIKNALLALGFTDVEIQEGIGQITYDGEITYDGTNTYGGGLTYNGSFNYNGLFQYSSSFSYWAIFRVLLNIDDFGAVDIDTLTDIASLINEYKNVRSRLFDVSLKSTPDEGLSITEEFTITII